VKSGQGDEVRGSGSVDEDWEPGGARMIEVLQDFDGGAGNAGSFEDAGQH
jgi:hypothetical protein